MVMKPELVKCKDCGRVFERRSVQKVRCDKCQEKHGRNLMNKYHKKRRETFVYESKNDPNICKKVKTCIYRGKMGGTPICNYLEIMGHRRPCGVQNCTVYEKGKSLSERVSFYDQT